MARPPGKETEYSTSCAKLDMYAQNSMCVNSIYFVVQNWTENFIYETQETNCVCIVFLTRN